MKKIIFSIILIGLLVGPILVLAAPNAPPDGQQVEPDNPNYGQPIDSVTIKNPIGKEKGEGMIWDFLAKLLKALMPFFEILLAFFWVLVGYQFVTAQGNVEKVKTANQNLVGAAIGTAIIVGANILIKVLQELTNFLKV